MRMLAPATLERTAEGEAGGGEVMIDATALAPRVASPITTPSLRVWSTPSSATSSKGRGGAEAVQYVIRGRPACAVVAGGALVEGVEADAATCRRAERGLGLGEVDEGVDRPTATIGGSISA